MNLFVLGWNLPQELSSVALAELRQMTEVYPQLDPETTWHFGQGEGAFAASMHTATQAAAPRCYVWQSEDQVTFYDGCPVARTGGFPAHDAEALSSHWGQLPEALEGQFVAVRLTGNPPCIELLTDWLGVAQVYYLHHGNMWLVSNSVGLISRIVEANAWDPLGVSLFLSVGWVGGDRTLRRDVRVIPGGEHWQWQRDSIEPRREAYYPLSKPASQRRRRPPLARQDVEQLADELTVSCRNLSRDFGELECPLTGGRDSRLIAALLINGTIPARYYTDGEPSSKDVQIGTAIARAFGLPHRTHHKTAKHVAEGWDTASWQLIRQTDGMVSLWQMADVLDQPPRIDRLGVRLWGFGGEIGRAYFSEPRIFVRCRSVEAMQHYMVSRFTKDFDGLIHEEAMELARSYLRSFVERAVDAGFSPLDVPDVFCIYDCLRRWGGANARKALPASDLFAPLCTRPFLEAAFSMSALYRYSEPLHYELTQLLVPQLHGFPSEKGPWRSQNPLWNVAKWMAGWPLRKVPARIRSRFARRESKQPVQAEAFDRPAWLEAQRSALRELCLDQSNSGLWSFVDRSVFERITSPAADPAERHRRVYGLLSVATLFHYALT